MTHDAPIDRAAIETRLLRVPYHQWLGLRVTEARPGEIVIAMTWREEMVAHPERRYTHGGILAALVDIAADYAIATTVGRASPTIDLVVDYHRPADPGDLVATGRVSRLGSTLSVASAEVRDAEGRVLATGRGLFIGSTAR